MQPNSQPPKRQPSRTRALTERALATLEHFLHIEAVSGLVLLGAAALALIWANSPLAASYHALWNTPFAIQLGQWSFSRSLHFWINDGLMTVFFLVVGLEIRREIHEGALSNLKQAALPIAAACGGVGMPALIYLALNHVPARAQGWAVPTATDIAFAVGVLALLGRSVPRNIRVFLLMLAVIDDILAVLIIALVYSGGFDLTGFAIAFAGVLMVLVLQHLGISSMYAYAVPSVVVWIGFIISGVHPALAGVILGLLTPALPARVPERPLDTIARITQVLNRTEQLDHTSVQITQPLRQMRLAQRRLLAPVVHVQILFHPWVAYGVMPLFALANAGVSFSAADLHLNGAGWVIAGVTLALVLGKPLGIISVTALLVRLRWCQLPPGVTASGVVLIGMLAGIGFTMSIFIAILAFDSAELLTASKLGVLLGSLLATLLGLGWGALRVQGRVSATHQPKHDD